jgi:signal transduction histidine kinase
MQLPRFSDVWRRFGVGGATVAFAVLGLAVMWTAGILYFRFVVDRQVEATYRVNDNLAATFAAHTAQSIKGIEGQLRVTALMYQKSAGRFDLPRFVQEAGFKSDLLLTLVILDHEGRVVMASAADYPRISHVDREHFQVHATGQTQGVFSGRPIVGRYNKSNVLPFSIRLSGPKGEFQGVIVAGVNPQYFINLYQKVDLGSKGAVSFFGLDGFIRARITAGETGVGQDVRKAPMIPLARSKEAGRLLFTAVTDNVTRYYSFQRVPGYPLSIAVGQADTEALLEVNRIMHTALVGGVLATLLVLVATALLLRGLSRDQKLRHSLQQRSTELQAANEKLRHSLDDLSRTQKHLVQTEKMAALGGLVAGIAHEINTPVGIGVTAASLLDDKVKALAARYESGAMSREDLSNFLSTAGESASMVLANLRRAAELIRSFKQVAVDQTGGKRRKFYLKEYLQEVIRSLSPQLGPTHHSVSLSCPQELLISSNPGDYSQVITNLVMNSLFHGFEGIEAGHIQIVVSEQDDGLLLRYSDDGRGISEEHLPHVFEPFYTTKRGQGGSGLGLHVIYNIVTQGLGGSISCSSTPGQGVVFYIRIPRAAVAVTD